MKFEVRKAVLIEVTYHYFLMGLKLSCLFIFIILIQRDRYMPNIKMTHAPLQALPNRKDLYMINSDNLISTDL
jgi:hypothetical protein